MPGHLGSTNRSFSGSQNGFSAQRTGGPRSLLPSVSLGFTTAGEHFKSVLMPLKQATNLASYDSQARPQKNIADQKMRKDNCRPTQASLNTFFAQVPFKPAGTQDFALLEKGGAMPHGGIGEPSLPAPPPIQKTANVPNELLSHKVCNTTLSLKRPRLVLDEATSPRRNR